MDWTKWYAKALVTMMACLLPTPSSSEEELTFVPEVLINGSSSTQELTIPPEEIIDGQYVDTTKIEFPFFINGDPPGTSCGGSLIADDLVLTAAHCCLNSYNYNNPTVNSIVFKKDYLITIAPVFANAASEKTGYHVKAVIEEVFVHPNYGDATSEDMDFCILKLESPVQNAITICLPNNKGSRAPAPGDILTITGFGATATGGAPPTVLKKASSEVLGCTSLFPASIITVNMLCGHEPNSPITIPAAPGVTCQGDSGGPVFDKYGIQYGVVSFGYGPENGGCDVGTVYAYVPSALPWIDKVAKYADSKIDKKDCWKPPKVGSKKGKKRGRRLHKDTRIERVKGGKRKEAISQFEISPNGQVFSTSKGVYNNRLDGRKL